MVRSKRLKVVVDLAKRTEDAAAQKLTDARRVLDGEIQRLRDLEDYYDQYERSQQQLRTDVQATDIEKIRLFLQQLATAKQAQKYQVENVNNSVKTAMNEWQECHLKHKLLREMVERYKNEEQVQLNKREQKILDEWFASQQRK